MSPEPHLKITPDDRFDRLRRIMWWDQEQLHQARLLVIGAGALGNEILKNLALLGVGNIFVADLDTIEESNLSRSILYRAQHRGRPKAEIAVQAIKDIYPAVKAQAFHGNIIYELGLGVYNWADVVIAGLDNREARLHVNRCCWKTSTPWVDGATEELRGVVRVFVPPDGPCFECTMTETDWQILDERRGCAGLRAELPPEGVVPTTPITASIIGALQCQEAVKLLHKMEGLQGRGMIFDGIGNDTYTVKYNQLEDCNSHETFTEIVRLNSSIHELTLRDLLRQASARLGSSATLEFNHEIMLSFYCPDCNQTSEVCMPLGNVHESEAACDVCGRVRRAESVKHVQGTEAFLDRTFAELGIPPFDLIVARQGRSALAFEFAGDAPAVLGQLYQPADP